MALIKCSSCGNEISQKAATCPKCGHPNEKAKHLSGAQVFVSLALAGGMIWFFAGGGLEKQAARGEIVGSGIEPLKMKHRDA